MRGEETVLIEGHASLFGVADLMGDVVRPGAFAASLTRHPLPPMLMQHAPGHHAGRWVTVRETGRGLYARGLVDPVSPGGRRALDTGLDGLSIGFRPVRWRPNATGRELIEIDLIEISLVAAPALPAARFTRLHERLATAA